MQRVELELSSREAEEVLIALYLRMHTTYVGEYQRREELEPLRAKLNEAFERSFGWEHVSKRWSYTGAIKVRVGK